MCDYSDLTDYKCPHESLEDSDYCIFHLKDDNKNVDEFNSGINELLETEEDSIDFHGFYFPPGTSDFSNRNFQKSVIFMGAKFSGEAHFWFTKFSDKADFTKAGFSGEANFIEAGFSDEAVFSFAKFSDKADFWGANFSEVIFHGTEFIGKFLFIPTESKTVSTIYFTYTLFSDFVRIKGNLSQCYFHNSNIERADLTDSTWLTNKEKKLIIWEEHQGKISSDLKELEGIYRRLKQSYQKYGDNDTAGNFYYQEMECKRKQMNFFPNLFWNIFYKRLCGYGEEPFNVIWASLFIIFVSAFSFLFGGIEFLGSEMLNKPAKLIQYNPSLNSNDIHMMIQNFDSLFNDFLLCVYTSFITFTTLGYGDVHPIGWSRLVATIESGLGIFMTALFIFVFTRKMLR